MIRFAENLNKMIAAGLGGALEAPSTEVAVGHCIRHLKSSGAVASFKTNIAAPIRSLRVDMQPIQAGSGDPSPDNVRPITGRDSATVWREASYDPSADPALTIPLGQTVYGGTLDVVSGELVVDMAMVDLGTLTWKYIESYNGIFYTDLPTGAKLIIGTTGSLCSIFAPTTADDWQRISNYTYILREGLNAAGRCGLAIRDNDYTVPADFTTAVTGQKLVYELAQPITITLTPEQLTTLKGDNNVWSDAGDVTLDYPYYEETEGY